MTPRRLLLPSIAAALIVASGAWHRAQAGRWWSDGLLDRAASAMERIPRTIGPWTSIERTLDDRQLRVAQATGAIARRYERTSTVESGAAPGEANSQSLPVDIMLLCGPHGPISVHPPTICFTAAGYQQVTAQRRVRVPGPQGTTLGEFWTADFDIESEGRTSRIRTFWAWSDGERWSAPDSPRLTFAGTPVLYKLYITRPVVSAGPDAGAPETAEPIELFLADFLPAVGASISTEAAKVAAAERS